jgi:hypothetical protein
VLWWFKSKRAEAASSESTDLVRLRRRQQGTATAAGSQCCGSDSCVSEQLWCRARRRGSSIGGEHGWSRDLCQLRSRRLAGDVGVRRANHHQFRLDGHHQPRRQHEHGDEQCVAAAVSRLQRQWQQPRQLQILLSQHDRQQRQKAPSSASMHPTLFHRLTISCRKASALSWHRRRQSHVWRRWQINPQTRTDINLQGQSQGRGGHIERPGGASLCDRSHGSDSTADDIRR